MTNKMIDQARDLELSVIPTTQGSKGVSESVILPGRKGRIRFHGSSWKAQCVDRNTEIATGEIVHIIGRKGLTLLIESCKPSNSALF